jgi:VIT1/CCC1 family predicted Fe2+/Mn2+ transporter
MSAAEKEVDSAALIPGASPARSALQTVLIGGLATAVAFLIARAIS